MPSSAYASEPRGSLSTGRPNSKTPGMPMLATSFMSFTISSIERRNCPGIEPIGSRMPRPWTMNSG